MTSAISQAFANTNSCISMASKTGDLKYFDILVLGRVGCGKSTTGNKLLDVDVNLSLNLKEWRGDPECEANVTEKFEVSKDEIYENAVTKECRLLSNEKTKVRVLDVSGFGNLPAITNAGNAREANEKILKDVVRIQERNKLAFQRVLYFLPTRGPLERSDGSMQQELRLIYDTFTESVFDYMVVIATNPPRNQKPFNDEDMSETRRSFKEGLHSALNKNLPCPVILYISTSDRGEQVLNKVKYTQVKGGQGLQSVPLNSDIGIKSSKKRDTQNVQPHKPELTFQKHTEDQKHCNVAEEAHRHSPRHNDETNQEKPPKCSKCSSSLESQLCHPIFTRHSLLMRIVGSFLNIVSWPFHSDSESWWPGIRDSEFCANCSQPRCTPGCIKLNQEWTYRNTDLSFILVVSHE